MMKTCNQIKVLEDIKWRDKKWITYEENSTMRPNQYLRYKNGKKIGPD